jgi:hypothetical protein
MTAREMEMREALAKLANHPNLGSHSQQASAPAAQASAPAQASEPTPRPKLTPEQVDEMMRNFGKKPAHVDGPEDPGTQNICIGCE